MIALIDNYDSFTYNLAQYLGELGAEVRVFRNDQISVDEVAALAPTHVVLSPGPGTPNDAGITLGLIARLAGSVPLLGVCLGHQAIGQAFGGKVVRAGRVMHGKTSRIRHDGGGVFAGVPDEFVATRYHSLVVERESLPAGVKETHVSLFDGSNCGIALDDRPVFSVQYHPEASPGPRDSHYLFDQFARLMRAHKRR